MRPHMMFSSFRQDYGTTDTQRPLNDSCRRHGIQEVERSARQTGRQIGTKSFRESEGCFYLLLCFVRGWKKLKYWCTQKLWLQTSRACSQNGGLDLHALQTSLTPTQTSTRLPSVANLDSERRKAEQSTLRVATHAAKRQPSLFDSPPCYGLTLAARRHFLLGLYTGFESADAL